MNRKGFQDMDLNELAELAERHEVVDTVHTGDARCKLKIGAASFDLDREGTREFLIRLLRSRTGRNDT